MKRRGEQSRLKREYFSQELPPDVRQLVWEELRFRAGVIDSQGKMRADYSDEVQLFGLDSVRDEIADDFINRHNWRRTIGKWIKFAEKEL